MNRLNHNTLRLTSTTILHNEEVRRISNEKLRPALGWRLVRNRSCRCSKCVSDPTDSTEAATEDQSAKHSQNKFSILDAAEDEELRDTT